MNDDTQLKSKILLSPEVRRIKNAIIKKFADEPLDVMSKFVKEIVETENDTIKRLGAMAARVEILRMRISQIADKKYEDNISKDISDENIDIIDKKELLEENQNNNLLSDWVRLRIDENSEINGVRFPKGVVIDVSKDDAEKLLSHKKASYVKEEENQKSDKEDKNLPKEDVNVKKIESTSDQEVVEKSEKKIEGNETKEVVEKSEKKIEENETKEVVEEADDISKEKNNIEDQEDIKKEPKKPSPEELLAGFKMDEKK